MKNKNLVLFGIFRGFCAILISLLVAFVLILIMSNKPFEALKHLLISPLFFVRGEQLTFNLQSFYTILAAMIPITFTGLGVCVMFGAKEFNLGGEGCVMLGGFVASIVGMGFVTGTFLDAVFAVLVATLVGGLIMLISAFGKVKMNANEMVSSLMLNYVILYVVLHFLNSVFADRAQGALMSYNFAKSAKIPDMVQGGSHLTWGFVIAIVATILVSIFMYKTKWGYAIRMIGINKDFSRYAGIKVVTTLLLAHFLGGALSAMGGAIENLGRYDNFIWQSLPGYGWTGVTIAILAKNNPIFIPFSAFFISYLNKGCQLMATYCDIPAEMISIIQAVIFLFFAAEHFLAKTRQKIVVKNTLHELEEKVKGEGAC